MWRKHTRKCRNDNQCTRDRHTHTNQFHRTQADKKGVMRFPSDGAHFSQDINFIYLRRRMPVLLFASIKIKQALPFLIVYKWIIWKILHSPKKLFSINHASTKPIGYDFLGFKLFNLSGINLKCNDFLLKSKHPTTFKRTSTLSSHCKMLCSAISVSAAFMSMAHFSAKADLESACGNISNIQSEKFVINAKVLCYLNKYTFPTGCCSFMWSLSANPLAYVAPHTRHVCFKLWFGFIWLSMWFRTA